MQYNVQSIRYYLSISVTDDEGQRPIAEYELWSLPPVVPTVGSRLFVGRGPEDSVHVEVKSVQHEFRLTGEGQLMQLISLYCAKPVGPPR